MQEGYPREVRYRPPLALGTPRQELVTAAAFGRPVDAHLARTRLEAEGIEAFVADEHIVSVHWLCSPAVGGVKVRVWAPDLERARSLLEIPRPRHSARFVTDDLDASRCPRCGSLEVEERFSRRLTFASALLFGFPLPLLGRRARCGTCGSHWRLGASSGEGVPVRSGSEGRRRSG